MIGYGAATHTDERIALSTLRRVRAIADEHAAFVGGADWLTDHRRRQIEADARVACYSLMVKRHPNCPAGPMVRAVKRFFGEAS